MRRYTPNIPAASQSQTDPVTHCLSVCQSVCSLPYLTLPYLTLPYLTLPYLTLPYLTLPYLLTLPCPTFTLPYLYLTLPYPTNLLYSGSSGRRSSWFPMKRSYVRFSDRRT